MINDFDKFNFETVLTVKQFSTSSLCNKVKSFASNSPGWITDMLTDPKAPIAKCTVHEAMCELNLRREVLRSESKVKELITDFTTDKVVTISPEGYTVTGKKGSAPLMVHGGHILRGDDPEKVAPAVTTSIARDNIVDSVVFPITSPANKDVIEVISGEKTDKIVFPVYPVSSVFGTEMSRSKIVDVCKMKISANPEVILKMILAFPPRCKWQGLAFSVDLKYARPKVYNCAALYSIVDDHRGVRGPDTGCRADCNRGYYYGFMPTSLYRASYVVSDVCMLGASVGTNCLEIKKVDGLFSNIVLQSLVVNGWVIRVVQDFNLPVHPKVENGILSPGIYHKVPFVTCIVHESFDDKIPTASSGLLYVNSIKEFLLDLPANKGRYIFTYCFLRDEFDSILHHLYPTAHAHSGQIIYCQAQQEKPLDIIAYIKRTIRANTYKTYHVYTREIFYKVDDFKFIKPFRLTQKPNKQVDDYKIEIDEEYITPWVYDGSYVKLTPDQKALADLVNKGEDERTTTEIDLIRQLMLTDESIVPEVPIVAPDKTYDSIELTQGVDDI